MEANRLNTELQGNGIPAKIILLCRPDVFSKLPGTNKNKIRHASGIYLDWYVDYASVKHSRITDLLNLRAYMSDPRIFDIFECYFPGESQDISIAKVLLDFTRYIPRDLIQLFKSLQKYQMGIGRILWRNVNDGLFDYSQNYFLPEVQDSLVGFLSSREITLIIELLGIVRKNLFHLTDLQKVVRIKKRYETLDLDEILYALYECSAIGNVTELIKNKGVTLHFKYRNRNSMFNPEGPIIIHRGLLKALNIRHKNIIRSLEDLII